VPVTARYGGVSGRNTLYFWIDIADNTPENREITASCTAGRKHASTGDPAWNRGQERLRHWVASYVRI